jgi:hypothetical protein
LGCGVDARVIACIAGYEPLEKLSATRAVKACTEARGRIEDGD